MARRSRSSLWGRHPFRVDVPIVILAAAAALAASMTMPLVRTGKLVFFHDDHALAHSVMDMWRSGRTGLAAMLAAFCILFPAAKVAILMRVWFLPLSGGRRRRLVFWLGVLGKWSMLDVFIVAMMIVIGVTRPWFDIEPRPGLYVLAAAIMLTILATILVERLVRKGA